MKRITSFIIVLCILISLCSCGTSYSNQINVGISEKPSTFDPQLASKPCELMIARNIFEGLMRLDENGNAVLGAAESYEVNGNTVTFTLRDELFWSNGKELTADDFVYGIMRAADPVTAAPFSELLYTIRGAEKIINGKAAVSTLGISAKDDKTVIIELTDNPESFIKTLAHPIFMPCNKEFFKECSAKYGRDSQSTLSNGSYYLRSWEDNASIIIARNPHYNGEFIPKAKYVVSSYVKPEERIEKLQSDDYDVIFSDFGYTTADGKNYKYINFDNTVWLLVFGKNTPADVITSFMMSSAVSDLTVGTSSLKATKTIYPTVTLNGQNAPECKIPECNNEKAKALFSSAVKKAGTAKVTTFKVGYLDVQSFKNIATTLASGWQSTLGAFVNIAPYSSRSSLLAASYNNEFDVMILPINVTVKSSSSAVSAFQSFASFAGIEDNTVSTAKNTLTVPSAENLRKAQNMLTSTGTVYPIAESSDSVICSERLTLNNVSVDYGNVDFSTAVKLLE